MMSRSNHLIGTQWQRKEFWIETNADDVEMTLSSLNFAVMMATLRPNSRRYCFTIFVTPRVHILKFLRLSEYQLIKPAHGPNVRRYSKFIVSSWHLCTTVWMNELLVVNPDRTEWGLELLGLNWWTWFNIFFNWCRIGIPQYGTRNGCGSS